MSQMRFLCEKYLEKMEEYKEAIDRSLPVSEIEKSLDSIEERICEIEKVEVEKDLTRFEIATKFRRKINGMYTLEELRQAYVAALDTSKVMN